MDHSQICNEAIRSSFLLPKRPAKAKFRMQDFAGNNLVGTIPYFVVETFNQPLRRHWNRLQRSCATTSSGLKFLKHADSTPSTHFLKGGADTPLTPHRLLRRLKRRTCGAADQYGRATNCRLSAAFLP